MREIRTVLVVGAGTMGHGIAQFFATHGMTVYLVDRTEALLARARNWISGNLKNMVDLQEMGEQERSAVESRLHFTIDLEEGAGYREQKGRREEDQRRDGVSPPGGCRSG